jgi:ketosteroid isomerase-like protein
LGVGGGIVERTVRAIVLRSSFLVTLAACSRPSESVDRAGVGVSVAVPSALAVPSSAPPSPDADVRSVVRAWNDALDRHDVDALAALYADDVRFYGRSEPLPRAAVLRAKRAAFVASPGFHQQIVSDIALAHDDESHDVAAHFSKRSSGAGPARDVKGYLVVHRSDAGPLLIVEESDEPSQAKAAARADDLDACEATAIRVVNALPRVKAFMDDAMKRAEATDGRVNFASLGPIDNGDGTFAVMLGYDSAERFENGLSYDVDRKTGKVSIDEGADTIPLDPASQAAVKKACAP